MPSRTTSRLFLLAAAFLFSTGGAAIKATSLNNWQVASFRSLVAAAAITMFVPAARKGWSVRILPVAAAYAATLALFVTATKLTTAANAILLQSSAPLYLLLLGPLLLHEKIRRGDVAVIVAVVGGMSLFFLRPEQAVATAPDPVRGNLVAVASGVTWALTLAGLRWLATRSKGDEPAMATVVAGNLIAFAACLPMALPVSSFRPADALSIGYLGVFQIGLAYLAMTAGIRRVPAFEASTLLLVEPALNPLWTWLLHGERPGPWALAGGGVILAATFANIWWKTRAA